MNDYVVKGYVVKLFKEEVFSISNCIWYFLYYGVINFNKVKV